MADSGATRQTRIVAAAAIAVTIKWKKKKKESGSLDKRVDFRRENQGAFNQLMKELRLCDVLSYRNFVRMDASTFEELLTRVAPRIIYQDTVFRQAIPPAERLAIT